VSFLEETFSAATAPPNDRYHQQAARVAGSIRQKSDRSLQFSDFILASVIFDLPLIGVAQRNHALIGDGQKLTYQDQMAA
jgi:hypothetical protein